MNVNVMPRDSTQREIVTSATRDAALRAAGERARVLALLRRFGWNATSFQVLEPGFRYWFDADDACVAYVDTGSAWVVAGAPIAAHERLASVAERFVDAAHINARRVVFFGTEQRFADASGYHALPVGTQPVWQPRDWPAVLRSSRSLREQLRRARSKGVLVRRVKADELARSGRLRIELQALIARWLQTRRMAAMGFLVSVRPFELADERRLFVATLADRVVGFLVLSPVYDRNGWLVEHLIRTRQSPNGMSELLIDHALRDAANGGSQYVTLGLAPLAGPLPAPLRVARRLGRALYDFRGLHAFKAKLKPSTWVPIYVAYPPDGSALLAIYDTLVAFSRVGLMRFGWLTAKRLLRERT